MARLKKYYQTQLRDELKNKLGLKNVFEVPKITKIVVNIGVGEAAADSKKLSQQQQISLQLLVKSLL